MADRAEPRVMVPGVTGGILAVAVSLGVFVSLGVREVGYNALNLFTVVVGTLAGVLAVRGARRQDGAGLGWGIGLLVAAVAPAAFGWIGLLYLPAMILLLVAVGAFISAR